jgi:pimeloyl-ACP methyl ester carboxylesterase
MYPDPRCVQVGGRTLTVEDAGPADGFPVLVHSGGGSRHLEPAAVRAAGREGLRLIGYDRPSYGGSTPFPGRRVADCAVDVRAVLTQLDISRAAVWGFSGGGPYALATAALLPEVVIAACVLASIGPCDAPGLDWLDGMDDSYREEVRLFFADRPAAREKFRVEGADLYRRLSESEAWMRIWGERAGTDPAHSQETADYLAAIYRDGWTRGDEGWWDDWSAFLGPWGFALGDIAAPVSLWHGLADQRSPAAHGRWLAERIPHVTAHFPADEDHTNVEENNRAAGYAWIRAHVR